MKMQLFRFVLFTFCYPIDISVVCVFLKDMSETTGKSQKISLRAISEQFFGALQEQFDVLAFQLCNSRLSSEDAFESFLEGADFPKEVALLRRFEQTKALSDGRVLRGAFAEALNVLVSCMDSCFTLSIIASLSPNEREDTESSEQKIQAARQDFSRLSLPEKLNSLSQVFEVDPALKERVLALHDAANCIIAGEGVVTREMTGNDGIFTLVLAKPNGGSIIPDRNKEPILCERLFQIGQPLWLNKSDLLLLPVTIASFLHELFDAMQEFGKQMEKLNSAL